MGKDRGWEYLNSSGEEFDFDPDNDGSWGYENEDGSGSFYGNDGSWGYKNADGSASYYGADGSWGYKNADGSSTYYGNDGSWGYKNEDGSGSFYGADNESEFYDAHDDDEDEDNDVSLGAAVVGGLFGLGLAAYAASKEKHEEERLEEERRLAEERRIEAEKQRVREEKARERRKKRFAFYKRHWKGLLLFFVILGVAGFLGFKYWEFMQSVPVGISSKDVVGQNYEEVERILEESGFSYVYSCSRADLSYGEKDKENTVIEVNIAGDTEFSSMDRYPKDSDIEIIYHALMEATVPVSAKESKGMDYKELAGLFEDAGFVNISYEKDADLITGWITKENSVKSISIDGDSKFSEDASYRIDAEVVITYHAFK